MRFTTLTEWLGWLETNHPKEIDLGLERIKQVAARLNLLNPKAKIITVAGTNGKGSCVTACGALLQAAGHSVGVYTSPHLLRYNERIKINGEPASDDLICNAFQRIYEAAGDISLTYFEYGTLAALDIFQSESLDYWVLEIGLGGRLDAVNILDPQVAVITSIAIDHQDWLGDNREDIGFEKAGILRDGCQFVCADAEPPQSIINQAQLRKVNAHYLGHDFHFDQAATQWNWTGKKSDGVERALNQMRKPHLPLPSMAAAIQAIELVGVQLAQDTIDSTLYDLELAGRFQSVNCCGKQIICDVAHNPAATAYLAGRLRQSSVTGKTYALVAMMADKDRVESLSNLVSEIDGWWVADLSHLPRAATYEQLENDLISVKAKATHAGKIEELAPQIIDMMTSEDRLVVFGSFFTVAAMMEWLQTVPT